MRATHLLRAFLRLNAHLLTVVIFLAGCDSAVERQPAESVDRDRVEETTESPDRSITAPIDDSSKDRIREVEYAEDTEEEEGPSDPATTAPTGLTGRLAFVSSRDGYREIYAINVDGTALTRLTNSRARDADPVWSPDGSKIAFERDGQILVMDSDGSSVARRGVGWNPAWSPAGSILAFSALVNGGATIVTVNETAAGKTILTTEPGANIQPSWWPDGRGLVFVSDYAAYDFALDIYTINVDGTGRRQLTRGFKGWPEQELYLHPKLSPDGSMIAFVYGSIVSGTYEIQIDSDVRFKVAVMTADGVFDKDLAWAGDIPWKQLLDPGSLSWSPDGLGIAYSFIDCDRVNNTGCSNERSVRYVSLDRTQLGTLVEDAHSPSWRP